MEDIIIQPENEFLKQMVDLRNQGKVPDDATWAYAIDELPEVFRQYEAIFFRDKMSQLKMEKFQVWYQKLSHETITKAIQLRASKSQFEQKFGTIQL